MPTPVIWNTLRTSAWPSSTSLNLGASMPFMAVSILIDAVVDDAVHPHIHVDAGGVDSLALLSGRTLKPTMMALEVEASITSLSLMAPTAQWMTRTGPSSLESFLQRGLDRLGGALDVCLDDDVQILHLAPPGSG